ncbi:MAG: TauD/TfdA family dioxygenase, partial [SAR324 cluster bacterium]|nr:TauD/TfdA family dioxygenase [SAR324 cluster bacterium]
MGSLSSSELNWHSDQSYRTRPATGVIFYAVEVREGQGDTSWRNMQAAYESLSAETKREKEGLSCVLRNN